MIEVPCELVDDLRRELLDHMEAELPNEACALLQGSLDGEITEVIPTRNVDASPTSYTVDPEQMFAAYTRAEDMNQKILGVAHSHPNGPAAPSATDRDAALDPEWLYVIVGSNSDIRAFRKLGTFPRQSPTAD